MNIRIAHAEIENENENKDRHRHGRGRGRERVNVECEMYVPVAVAVVVAAAITKNACMHLFTVCINNTTTWYRLLKIHSSFLYSSDYAARTLSLQYHWKMCYVPVCLRLHSFVYFAWSRICNATRYQSKTISFVNKNACTRSYTYYMHRNCYFPVDAYFSMQSFDNFQLNCDKHQGIFFSFFPDNKNCIKEKRIKSEQERQHEDETDVECRSIVKLQSLNG